MCVGGGGGGGGAGGVAQLVKRQTEQSGAIATLGQGICSQVQLSVQTLLRCPHSPACNRNVCAQVKNPKLWQSAHRKCYTHR